ncbi:hypothetical protein EVG20_g8852 [Dentipellis fragilis]|uniref:Peptidase C14 caspase domain-containing protein n=1 Tax=Dentipellis fragilis TaxID=205917 RepID=A0A4Y9Y4D5_9AGAM|nr:hypothetical protein EVG20_g8852 [Dentipellis fragilis]
MKQNPAALIEEHLLTGRRRALLVGINYLRAPRRAVIGGPLKEPIKDVRKMKDLLINVFGYSEDHIVVMTDDHDLNEQTVLWPTKQNIVSCFTTVDIRDAQPGDSFVFHFAGHSTQKPVKVDKNEIDGLDEGGHFCSRVANVNFSLHRVTALITWDAKCILDDILRRILVQKLPDGCKLTAIFDTCHSGTLLDLVQYYNWDEGLHSVHSFPDLGKLFNLAVPREDSRRERRISLHQHDENVSAALHEVVTKSHRPVNQSATHVSAVSASMPHKKIGLLGSQGQAAMRFARRRPAPLAHKHQKPVVISLSACTDDQQTWEDRDDAESSMSKILCNILRKDPSISAFGVIEQVRKAISAHTFQRHKIVLRDHRRWSTTSLPDPRVYPLDLDRPQLGSLYPLHHDEPFLLKRCD